MVLSYRDIACCKPDDIFQQFYFFIDDMVSPSSMKSSVVSILFPYNQIIPVYKITIFVKVEILVVKLELNLLQFFKELQSKGQNFI